MVISFSTLHMDHCNAQVTPGDSQIYIRWNTPIDDGGSPITFYHVFAAGLSFPNRIVPYPN